MEQIAVEILESMPDAFMALDQEWRYTYVNGAAERLMGFRREEMVGRTRWEIFPEIIGTQFHSACRRAMNERVTASCEDYHAASGRWLEQTVSPSGDGIIVCARDVTGRKRAEEALRASEERFRRYFELGLIGMAITSPTKGIIEVNNEICEILGYERSELLQMTWAELTHPDDLAFDIANFNRVQAGDSEGYAIDKRWIRKDGQIIYATISVKCVRRTDGSVDYFVALLQDITERKHSENALRESEERYRTLFNSIDEGFGIIEMLFDEDGKPVDYLIVETNPAVLKQRELEQSPVGKTALELWPSLDPWWIELFGTVALTGEPVRLENQVKAENRWFSVYAFCFGGREGRQVAVLFTNITERRLVEEALRHAQADLEQRVVERTSELTIINEKLSREILERERAEEELRRSEAYLAEGQKMSHTGSGSWNVSTGKVFWSDETYRIYGFEPGQVKPSYELFLQIVHPDDRLFVEQTFDRVVREKTGYQLDFRIVRPDGIRYIHSLGRPVLNESGDLVEIVGTVVDVTGRTLADELLKKEIGARGRAEEDRKRLLRRLVLAQEEERRRIAREMHDEFGQQLIALSLRLAALKDQYGGQAGLRAQIEWLEAITKQLDSDVDALVWELRPPALDDLGLVAALSNYVSNWSEHSGIHTELHASGMEKGRLTSEMETVLYRVAQEALTNAAKHSRAGNVDILLERRSDHVSLIVEDDGIGFEGEQAFHAAEKGLGLIGMRERAALVGGTLEIESHSGRGATVFIRIPAELVPNGG